jgi:hypothetical protein
VSVVGIDINSILYDVTFTYNNNGATNPLRVGSLPDTDIPLARAGLLALLNSQSVESYLTILHFQPNADTISPLPTNRFEGQGHLEELDTGLGDWTDYSVTKSFSGVGEAVSYIAFSQFAPSIVPEPSAIAGCLGLVGMGLIGWRRKSNRKKK